ncbi:hypothetical protein ABZ990_19285 [Streptomyces sp. NPDC046203]|uniref:tyrosine-type recombinase/integrase n=1 Tax=Streptomyces sp. NPDC046203 TaxID=3154602 RepID=UPI0034004FB8
MCTRPLANKTVSAGTLESYERIVRLHALPHLGSKTISQVTAEDIEGLYTQWLREGAALNTIESRHITLSALFSHAVRHRRITGNPVALAEKLDNPVIPVDERKLPSFDEITAIAESIGPRLSPAVWLMTCRGLRIGESLGVFPEDIHDGVLRIWRQVTRYKDPSGKYVQKYAPLKHRKEGEWRDIPIPDALEHFIDRLPISNANGGLPYPDLLHKSWDRAIKRLGLPEYNPHDSRHERSAAAPPNGVLLGGMSRRFGRRSIEVAVDRCGRLVRGGREWCRQDAGPRPLTARRASGAPGAVCRSA